MKLHSWISHPDIRFYPASPAPRRSRPLQIEAARNEVFSLQTVLRLEAGERQTVQVEVRGPGNWKTRVRLAGYVPVAHLNPPIEDDPADIEGRGHIPGYVPDPLLETDTVLLPPEETHAFRITVEPGRKARAGRFTLMIKVRPETGRMQVHKVPVRIYPLDLPKRRDFRITNWFYCDALIDRYKTDMFDRRFWELCGAYMGNMAAHGQDTVYVPIFTPPLDGIKRPTQLLRVRTGRKGRYTFDWRDVKRYTDLARRRGLKHFEWCHLFTQWGVEQALRIYHGQGKNEKRLWAPATGAVSRTYREFLGQFLPAFRKFLETEKLLKRSFFHVSDEPHGTEHLAAYRRARGLLAELAPWMKVMDALTEIEFARQGLTDMPIPSIRTALDFHKQGIPSWCYYCCGPRGAYLNRLMDTPLAKIAMHGLLFYRWPFRGFLHWGYNYWYASQTRDLIDPYTASDGLKWDRGWAYGDPFMVYPGDTGPVDSIRWETFGESLQDYCLLQARDIDPGHPLLKRLRSFTDFPKSIRARAAIRHRLLAGDL